MFVTMLEILVSLPFQGEQHHILDLVILVTFLDILLNFGSPVGTLQCPSFLESRNMDSTTLDFFPSGVLPLIPFLAFIALLECVAFSLQLILFRSLFSVVLR